MKYFFIILASLFFCCVQAQQVSYVTYNKINALPCNEVYDIMLDKKGFLWIATDDGLVKYNGDVFTLYKNYNSKGNSFSYLQQDKQGRVWCSSFNGQIFYLENDTLKIFGPYDKLDCGSFPEIVIGKNNQLIITNRSNNYWIYNLSNFKLINVAEVKNRAIVNSCIMYDSTLYTTLVTKHKDEGINKFAAITNNLIDTTQNNILSANNFYKVSNNFFLNQSICYSYKINKNKETLLLFSYRKNTFQEKKLLHFNAEKLGLLQTIWLNNDSSALLGTSKGIFTVSNIYDSLSKIEYVIKDVNVSKIIKDEYGNIWIATLSNGLLKINANTVYTVNLNTENSNEEFIHFASNKKDIIVGITANHFLHYYNTTTKAHLKTQIVDVSKIQNLFYDEKKEKFIICQNKVYELQIATNYLKLLPILTQLTNSKKVLLTQSNNELTMGGSLNLWNAKNNNLQIIERQRGYDMCLDTNSFNIWFASLAGLKIIDTNFKIRLLKDENNNTIYANKVTKNAQYFFASTFNNGVFIFSNNKLFKHLNDANILATNNVKKIICNTDYIAVLYGEEIDIISCQNFKVIQTISIKSGLYSSVINDIAFIKNQLYVVTNNRVQYFNIEPNTIASKAIIYIDKIITDNKNYSTTALPSSFIYNTKIIAITFAAIDLNSSTTFKYLYRLLPNDSVWKQINNLNATIDFENLSSGNYCFQYQLLSSNTQKDNPVFQYKFAVDTPFWKKWHFILLCILLLFLILYAVYEYSIKQLNKKHTEELNKAILNDKLKQAQLAALKVQMNPHFIFNALNSIQDFILLNEKENANFYLGRFSKLMRMVLDMSNKDSISFKDELELLKIYLELEALRFENNFDYFITLYDNLTENQEDIQFPPLLIQPYVENALKHGLLHKKGKRVLKIDFELKENFLVCIIEDNGIGRRQSQEINSVKNKTYTSFATGATENRLKLINSLRATNVSVFYTDKFDNENISMGTTVTLKIAVNAIYK